MQATMDFDRAARSRVIWLDLARTLALIGMAVYHLVWDMTLFGLLPRATVLTGGFRLLAVTVAGSFLFLAGVSLVLAHREGIRWRAFWQRLAVIAAAAALISSATFAVMPDSFIFFGILHSIAVASLLGLVFLRAPFWTVPVAALIVLIAPGLVGGAVFDTPALVWLGLGDAPVQTLDFEPVFPWFAAFLAGMTFARSTAHTRIWRRRPVTGLMRALCWPGRHSLAVYLVHQPVLLAVVWAVSRL